MISKTTKIVNNKFQVTFDFTSDDIIHSRKNSKGTCTVTHKGGNGTTNRQGIWEGIEIIETRTKIGSGSWRSHGTNKTVTIETSDNNVEIKAEAKYRLKTMGHHWNDKTNKYPFFWFGNIGGVAYRYRHGSFRDSHPKTPGSEHTVCIVPPDWKYVNCQWSDWAFKHAKSTPNWDFPNGKYEQRNGNYESAKETNGWISDTNNKQMWRKSMMFNFEKSYHDSIKSSGIATDPSTPILTVHSAKGDNGQVSIKYVDPAGTSGKIWLRVYCNNHQVDMFTYDTSSTFSNNETKKYTIDFNTLFGENYRGNDIYYEAWSKNNLGFECKNSTGRKGVHRYNGRPSIPTGFSVTGSGNDAIVYDYIDFSWNKSIDAENDSLTYDIWLSAKDPNGNLIRDSLLSSKISNLFLQKQDIRILPDKSSIEAIIRSSDNLLYSNWSTPIKFIKGAIPTGSLALIAPYKSGNLYNKRPRLCFSGYDKTSTFVVSILNKEYDSINNANMFTIHDDKVIFKPNFDIVIGTSFECYGYMKNEYGNSRKTPTYNFTIKKALENITEHEIINAIEVNQIQDLIADFSLVYNKSFNNMLVIKDEVITASTYNNCWRYLNEVNNAINSIIPNSVFDYSLISNAVSIGDINDDALWDKLVIDIDNI